jgi:hypothetical protein
MPSKFALEKNLELPEKPTPAEAQLLSPEKLSQGAQSPAS